MVPEAIKTEEFYLNLIIHNKKVFTIIKDDGLREKIKNSILLEIPDFFS